MDKSRTQYSILNILTGVGGYFINTVVGFACRIIFVRCLSADYLGINGLFSNVLSMLSLAELGIGSAIGFALYKPLAENDKKKIAELMQFYGKAYKIIGVIVGIVGVALLPFMKFIIGEAPNIRENLTGIYLLYLFNTSSTYFFSYRGALLQTAQQSYIVTGLSYIQTILQSILQMVYLLITHEYYGYLIICTIGTFLYNLSISKVAVKRYPYIVQKNIGVLKNEEKKSIILNVRDLMIYRLSGILVGCTDNIIITFFNGLSVTGLTSNYTLFTGTLTTLLNQIFNGVNASIGNHNAISNVDEREKMFNNFNLLNYWLFGWGAIGTVCVAPDLVRLCYGKEYVLNLSIPMVLALNMYMVGMQNAVWVYKNTLGIFHYGRFMQCGTAILNIIFSVVLGKRWGVFGILFASAIARTFTNIWYDPYCVYKYGFGKKSKIYFIRYIKFILCALVSLGISYVVCNAVSFSIVTSIIYKTIVCSLIFNIITIIVYKDTREFHFIQDKMKFILERIKIKIC